MTTIRRLACALAAALMSSAGAVHAADFAFSGGGFDGGGSLTGTFRGVDLNGNGLISTLDPGGEVLAFSLAFSGDAIVPDFIAGLADLAALAWRPSAGPAWGDGVNEGLHVVVPGAVLAGGLAALGEPGAAAVDEHSAAMSASRVALQVSPVPEPGTAALFALGLAALVARRRRR